MTLRRSPCVAVMLWAAASPSLAAEPAPRGQIDPVAAVSPLAAQPLARFSVTRERPLFSPTRRPPAPPPTVAPPPPPPAPPPDVELLGVVIDGEDAHALVRTSAGGKIRRLRIGEAIDGWKVGQIDARKLVLLRNGRMATFTMFTAKDLKRLPNTAATMPPNGRQPPVLGPVSRRRPPHL